ncbi:transposase family protein [Azospirillum sp. INR13]|uniref:DDE-type integrase/transposase/recombinase n=1 Tax=Azospirillum sp. INR13 TaxID=2596919 RepID=UPI0018927D8A|nr:DDE-type integrase/transposase/recombinase [Azospirillum sp. INR13]MBF5093112.1 transposase family protein [Azospirillum sp. INR13]
MITVDASCLPRGTAIRFGRTHCVVGVVADDFVILNDSLGRQWRTVPRPEFDVALGKRKVGVFFRDRNGRIDHVRMRGGEAIEFTGPLLSTAQWREKIVRFLLDHYDGCCSGEAVHDAFSSIRPPRDVLPIRDPRTVRRWVTKYRSCPDVRCLIDRHIDKGPKSARLHPKLRELIETAIDERFLRRERTTLGDVVGRLKRYIADENATRPPEDALHLPSDETIRRAIRQRDPYFLMVVREGRKAADEAFKPVYAMPSAAFPGEVVMMDFAVLDVMLVEEGRVQPVRLWLAAIIDAYSRRILSFHISDGPDTQAALDCLRKALLESGVVPRRILVDNGAAFVSERFRRACGELSIIVEYCEVGTPYHKGIMERVFRTLNQGLIHRIPGTTFGSIGRRGDYDPVAHAVVHRADFEAALDRFIREVYELRFHRGLGGIPADIWARGIEKHGAMLLPIDERLLRIVTGHEEHRRLSHGQIRIGNLHYSGPDVDVLREAPDRILCRHDPDDRLRLWAYNASGRRWIDLVCVESADAASVAALAAARSQRPGSAGLPDSDRRARQDEILSGLTKASEAKPANVAAPKWRRGETVPPGLAVKSMKEAVPPSPGGYDDLHVQADIPPPRSSGNKEGIGDRGPGTTEGIRKDGRRAQGGAGRSAGSRRAGGQHLPHAEQDPDFDPFEIDDGDDGALDAWAREHYADGWADRAPGDADDAEADGAGGDG